VTPGPRTGFAVLAAALAGCAGSEPQPRIDAVEPAQAYTDGDIRLTLTGADFIPSFRLDPVSGERVATMDGFSGRVGNQPNWVPLTDFGWVDPTQISATLDIPDPDDLGVGPCDVEITDPRGHKALLPGGFFALGRHTFAPFVTLTSPSAGDLYTPGSIIHGDVTAVDQPPGLMTALTWTYTEPAADDGSQRAPVTTNCPFRPGAEEIDCTFDVTISSGLDPGMTVNLEIVAADDAVPPNQTSVDLPIRLSALPTVSSVTPQAGGVAGGTNVVILGSGFVAGSRAYFDDTPLIPDGGIVSNEGTIISGYTPAHAAGPATVTVRSRLGLATSPTPYVYQLPPQIGSISPSYGTQGEDTPVQVFGSNFSSSTIIYIGQVWSAAVPLASASFVGETEITGVVRSSSGQATVWAFDPYDGWTNLPDGFFWIAP
jgi:IPT/TIG domain